MQHAQRHGSFNCKRSALRASELVVLPCQHAEDVLGVHASRQVHGKEKKPCIAQKPIHTVAGKVVTKDRKGEATQWKDKKAEKHTVAGKVRMHAGRVFVDSHARYSWTNEPSHPTRDV